MRVARVIVPAAAICLSAAGLSSASAVRQSINIPAQDLCPALQTLAKEQNFQLVYRSELVRDVRTAGAVGELTSEEALTRLLQGTGLTYRRLDDKTMTIAALPTSERGRDERSSRSLQVRGTEGRAERKNTEGEENEKSFWSRFRLAQLDQGRASNDRSGEKSDTASEKKSARIIQEVIVTARKRVENIQDVPISIAVVSADEIDRRGLVSAEDYLRGIPGVSQVDSQFGQAIVIRGLETSSTSQNFSAGSTVATYFGETPTTNSAGLGGGTNVDTKLLDIERVEVLRGPQGTAFGNSSLGGAVRTIPMVPKLDDFEGKVAVGYSVTSGTGDDNYNVQAVGNIPLIKNRLAIRAIGYQYEDSGFYRNVAGSDAAFQAAITPFGGQSFATDEEEVGSYYAIGGRIAAMFQASDDLRFTLSYLSQKTERDGYAQANTGTYEQAVLRVAPEHVVRGQNGGLFDTDIDLANAMMEYNLGWANVLATYSYVKSGSTYSFPWTAVGGPLPVSSVTPSKHRAHSGEIRLTTQLDGAWNFLGGLYAEDLEDEYYQESLWHGAPATNFFAPGERFLGDYRERRDLDQKAAFGEASWEFLPGLTLTGGVRGYDYDRTGRVEPTGFYGVTVNEGGADASGTSFRANLSYKPNDNALVYAGWAQGFRLGKPQSGLNPGLCDLNDDGIVDGTSNLTIESTRRVTSDEVDNYEFGGKFTLLDRRLLIAADVYRIEWSDVPVRTAAPGTVGSTDGSGCGFTYVANAGAARSDGVEFQANFQITEAFRVDFGGSWIDARLTKDAPALNASKGDRLPGSPEVNANLSAQYEFEIGGYEAFVRADSIYIGPFHSDLQESALTKSGDYVKVDATARLQIRDFNIDLFVRNLTNEDAFTFRDLALTEFYGYRLQPRTIGLQLGYTF